MASPEKRGERALASFGGIQLHESPMKAKDDDFFYGKSEEEKKTVDKEYLRTGVLRKKGLIFHNEREVRIDSDGILTYYHFD